MTRFVLFALILNIAPPALAADDGRLCEERLSAKRPTFSDLPFMQRRLWELERDPKNLKGWSAKVAAENAVNLRRRLEHHLRVTPAEKIATTFENGDKLIRHGELSYTLARAKATGNKERLAYIINEYLSRPVRIPITVSHDDGSLQLWPHYDDGQSLVSIEENRQINQLAAGDADLFIFNFIVLQSLKNDGNLVLDREHGLISSNFAQAFKYSMSYYIFHERVQNKKEVEKITIDDVTFALKDALSRAKHDWRSALEEIGNVSIIPLAARMISPDQARALELRLCILRALAHKTDPHRCPI